MASFKTTLTGSFDEVQKYIRDAILKSSISASYEDGFSRTVGGCRIAVAVYERYSAFGKNRVSLTLTLMEEGDGRLFVSAITSGGSQATFFKINTIGEEAFLDKVAQVVKGIS